jgi:acetolactate synthase-1/2/3 large subunit
MIENLSKNNETFFEQETSYRVFIRKSYFPLQPAKLAYLDGSSCRARRLVMILKTMDGAQALVRCLENEGWYIFGLSGGAAIPIFDALITTKTKIKLVLFVTSRERLTWPTATPAPPKAWSGSGNERSGATNTLWHHDRAHGSVPMIVLTGQTITSMLGKTPFRKPMFLASRCHRQAQLPGEERQRHSTDRARSLLYYEYWPSGSVLIDLPKDITQGPSPESCMPRWAFRDTKSTLPSIKSRCLPSLKRSASRAGQYCLQGTAPLLRMPLMRCGTWPKTQCACHHHTVGQRRLPETHRLSLGMLGMHGTAYANKAMIECDLSCPLALV